MARGPESEGVAEVKTTDQIPHANRLWATGAVSDIIAVKIGRGDTERDWAEIFPGYGAPIRWRRLSPNVVASIVTFVVVLVLLAVFR